MNTEDLTIDESAALRAAIRRELELLNAELWELHPLLDSYAVFKARSQRLQEAACLEHVLGRMGGM